MSRPGKLVVVSGPSGVGKSSVAHGAMERTDAEFSVSATTRAPRPGETDGQDYWFVSPERFAEMREQGAFLECAQVYDNWYGTPAEPVEQAIDRGEVILLDIDVQGGIQVHQKMPSATFVMVLPPSDAELVRRLTGRGTEDEKSLQTRITKAREQMQLANESGIYEHEIVNDDLDKAVDELVRIIESE